MKKINELVRISESPDKHQVCFSFIGKMDTDNCQLLSDYVNNYFREIIANGFNIKTIRVIFDLDEVTFVSSFFLRVCFVILKNVNKGNFKLINASQEVNSILKLSGIDKLSSIITKDEDTKVFKPFPHFSQKARVNDPDLYLKEYQRSIETPEIFWAEQAKKHIHWFKEFDKTLEWELPYSKWFINGKLNVCYNCLDRHLLTENADKTAIIWESELMENGRPVSKRYFTYRELLSEVCRFANLLKEMGVNKGDRVIIYLPMIPEAVFAMLACARIGAIHSVIFAGFSPQAIAERAEDCQAKMIITADQSYRRGKLLPLKDNVDKAIEILESKESTRSLIKSVLMIERTGNKVDLFPDRDFIYSDMIKDQKDNCEPETMDSEDVLFILYTSGSTGKPKGIFHSSAGYLLGAHLTFQNIMDIRQEDIYWSTADIGWITGHTYAVYGPLSNGATIYMYEGAPDYPEYDRFWKIIEENSITIFYTAPTAIRAFMKWGEEWIKKHDLSSIRLLGTVGEPINTDVWLWYFENIGKSKCPIVDTWWQTETGSAMISPLPGAFDMKPGSASIPFYGIEPDILDDSGKPVDTNIIGNLVIKKPWPSMARGIWASAERFRKVYWEDFPGYYFTGDCARKDKDGFFWIAGRTDDVIVVSGHNIGTAEVENALLHHHAVAEAAVVGRPDDHKHTVIVAFVSLRSGFKPSDELMQEIKSKVAQTLGHLAKPEEIRFTQLLPKTRSGKIMRRFLRQIAAGTEVTGDLTTLEDFSALEKLK
jgi:acetyl-CoA synthetase